MAETWPVTLPTAVEGNYRESPPDNLLRSSMDVGPDKVRQRSTAGPRPISWEMLMTGAQTATFDTFYVTTLANGSLTFNFTMPRTGNSAELRFSAPPSYNYLGGDYWSVSMQMEILP